MGPAGVEDGLSANMWTDGLLARTFGQLDDAGEVVSVLVTAYGNKATALDRMGRDAAVARVIREFEDLRPASPGRLAPAAWHSWGLDPLAAGDWAVFAPGTVTRFLPAMLQPHGRVHFCGEQTALANRGMEGGNGIRRARGARVAGAPVSRLDTGTRLLAAPAEALASVAAALAAAGAHALASRFTPAELASFNTAVAFQFVNATGLLDPQSAAWHLPMAVASLRSLRDGSSSRPPPSPARRPGWACGLTRRGRAPRRRTRRFLPRPRGSTGPCGGPSSRSSRTTRRSSTWASGWTTSSERTPTEPA